MNPKITSRTQCSSARRAIFGSRTAIFVALSVLGFAAGMFSKIRETPAMVGAWDCVETTGFCPYVPPHNCTLLGGCDYCSFSCPFIGQYPGYKCVPGTTYSTCITVYTPCGEVSTLATYSCDLACGCDTTIPPLLSPCPGSLPTGCATTL